MSFPPQSPWSPRPGFKVGLAQREGLLPCMPPPPCTRRPAQATGGQRGEGHPTVAAGHPGASPKPEPRPRAPVLTVADLALQEGGRGQARAHRVTEAALGVQALAGAALRQRPGAQVHVLGGRLRATGRPQEDSQLRENHRQPVRGPGSP